VVYNDTTRETLSLRGEKPLRCRDGKHS